MHNKKIYLALGFSLVAVIGGVVLVKQMLKPKDNVTVVEDTKVDLPVNVIDVSERPFITLSPDSTGHNLSLGINHFRATGTLEYELIYNTAEGDEGAFGRINLDTETQPISKQLLLGSRSAGGAVTYYSGITGGSISLTWGETKVKESFSFLNFDPTDPVVTSVDGRLTYTMTAKALKKGDVIAMMKTSGYGVQPTGTIVAGPYAVLTPTTPSGTVTVSIKLPAGDHVNPTIYELVKDTWTKLKTTVKDDTVSATVTGNTFVVTSD